MGERQADGVAVVPLRPAPVLRRGAGRRQVVPESGLLHALRSEPQPFINPDEGLLSLWSPKSACTTVLVWHLARLGMLKAAFAYHHFPHRYRIDVLEKGRLNRRATERFDAAAYTVVRFVRDPFRRAVSMYRHALRYHLLPGTGPWPLAQVRRRADARRGYSFVRFLETLAAVDPARCDIHLRPQRHPLEELLPPAFVINADRDSLTGQINRLETAVGLVPTDFEQIDWLNTDARRRHARTAAAAEVVRGSAAETVFTAADTGGVWPTAREFRSDRAEALVRAVFAADVAAYGLIDDEV
ncbi:sulfotransferase family 2 domain-containing protein [Novispirillum sp. DQ9]|uniref:sulfotransferase family 2 domain-containing protein n=1 Tax=Novispirillum sp. DQ9 TaxID=3398612 RepID=UPI003C7A6B79